MTIAHKPHRIDGGRRNLSIRHVLRHYRLVVMMTCEGSDLVRSTAKTYRAVEAVSEAGGKDTALSGTMSRRRGQFGSSNRSLPKQNLILRSQKRRPDTLVARTRS